MPLTTRSKTHPKLLLETARWLAFVFAFLLLHEFVISHKSAETSPVPSLSSLVNELGKKGEIEDAEEFVIVAAIEPEDRLEHCEQRDLSYFANIKPQFGLIRAPPNFAA